MKSEPVRWLSGIIENKVTKNPQYSLRAFAENIGVSPSTISRILSGKRNLTLKMALKIAESYEFTAKDREHIFSMFSNKEINESPNERTRELTEDTFKIISDWYHYGILQLMSLKDFKESYKWIARQLGISELESKLAIDRMLRVKLIKRDKDNLLVRTNHSLKTTNDIPSHGLKHFHKQILSKALSSLESDPVEQRDITSRTIAIDESKIPLAKEEIRKFRERMGKILSSGDKTRVYNLGIAFIPISKGTR